MEIRTKSLQLKEKTKRKHFRTKKSRNKSKESQEIRKFWSPGKFKKDNQGKVRKLGNEKIMETLSVNVSMKIV